MIADDAFLYVKDFCDLQILERGSLFAVHKLTLGSDLSSDICAMGLDEHHVYLSIRNGSVARLNKRHSFEPQIGPVSDSSR